MALIGVAMGPRLWQALGMGFLLLCGSGCAHSDPCAQHETIRGVERVFMHLPTQYTLLLTDGTLRPLQGNYRLVRDIPDGELWVSTCLDRSGWFMSGDIHLRAWTDLQGAGWRRGRQGQGTTEILE